MSALSSANESNGALATMRAICDHGLSAGPQWYDMPEATAAVAELIEAARRVQTIPSPFGTGYDYGTPEDHAYTKGFMYALRLVREPGFSCGLDAALARVVGGV